MKMTNHTIISEPEISITLSSGLARLKSSNSSNLTVRDNDSLYPQRLTEGVTDYENH
jgi:hypothetical protein